MAIQTFDGYLGPILSVLRDGHAKTRDEIRDAVAALTGLSPEGLAERLPSGRSRYGHRIGWATTYLLRAGAIERPSRGVYQISARGRDLLAQPGESVSLEDLRAYEEFRQFAARRAGTAEETAGALGIDEAATTEGSTPDERLEEASQELKRKTQADLLDRLLSASPRFFEQAVLTVLVAMGYGGSRADATSALGQSGDEGLDGVIREDRLGLDVIYVQAKRWGPERRVGQSEIREFVGSLEGARAKKGVFITTSSFSDSARDFVHRLDKRIVLIDGEVLTHLMFEHSVGVRSTATYEVKEINEDFFVED